MTRAHHLKQYDLTPDQYEDMLASQGGLCALCRGENKLNGRVQRLSVDHSHRSGRTRELLCVRCNTCLGLVNDSQSLLMRMAAYLAKHDGPNSDFVENNPESAAAREAEWQRSLNDSLSELE